MLSNSCYNNLFYDGMVATTSHIEMFTLVFFIWSTTLNDVLGSLVETLGVVCVEGQDGTS